MKTFLSDTDVSALVEAIKTAEEHSTGEIRVHIDSSMEEETEQVAWEVFEKLEMYKTKDRNAVLFHINFKQKYLSIIGDEGIHQKVCQTFWDKIHTEMKIEFGKGNYFEGLKNGILATGIELKKYFPVQKKNSNELPNDITFS